MEPSAPPSPRRSGRLGFAVAAAVDAAALALHGSNWLRTGVIQWGPALSMSGLLLLMLCGAVNIPRSKVLLVISGLGLVMLVLGVILMLFG